MYIIYDKILRDRDDFSNREIHSARSCGPVDSLSSLTFTDPSSAALRVCVLSVVVPHGPHLHQIRPF